MNANKKWMLTLAASMALPILLTGCGRTKINVNDYLTTEVNGYDGNGYAGWNVDLGQLVRDNYQAFGLKEGYSVMEYQAVLEKLKNNTKANYDKAEELSNGDTIKFTWDSDFSTLESDYKVKFTATDIDITVSGLDKIIELNPFDYIKMKYTGIAPYGHATIDNSALADLPVSIKFEITPDYDLDIGDTVKVSMIKGTEEACLSAGYRLTETEYVYTVEELDTYLTSLDDLPADASEKMDSHAQELLSDEIASYWDDPSSLDSITLLGNYLLTEEGSAYSSLPNMLVYVYEIKTGSLSYYSYVKYSKIMVLGDGTCSFNLKDATQPTGSVLYGFGKTFKHDGLTYIGYADLDTLFNEVVAQNAGVYDYQSTVS